MEPFALRDPQDEEGPCCLACAVEVCAQAQAATADADVLRIERWDSERSAWLRRGSTSIDRPPPPWITNHDAWTRAREAVREHWRSFPMPWTVVLSIYEAIT
jgi:hypothetical protein